MPMIDAKPITCPSWCADGPHTVDEHHSTTVYVPASGGDPVSVHWQLGATFPAVGVGTMFCPVDGDDAPNVSLHITSANTDLSLNLRVGEARQLLALLTEAVEQVAAA